jgi:uncharacterized protein DUF998
MVTRRVAAILLVAAAITYSAWLVELFLPDRLSLLHAYISEYSAVGQPYRTLFRTTDMIAAGCLLAAAFVIGRTVPRSWLVVTGLTVLGIAVVADANFTLDCASSVSVACQEVKQEGAVSFTDHMHVVTSVMENVGMVIALLGAERLAGRKLLPRLAIGIVVLTGLAIVVLDPLGPRHFAGGVLRIQLVAAGLALVLGARGLTKPQPQG